MTENMNEAITLESDLILKLKPIPEADIYAFMGGLKGGTYFNMGMYSSIPIARAYKSTLRLYKVVEMQAIGAGALNQGIKAVAIARGYVAPSGKDLIVVPAFSDILIEGEEKTAIKLIVKAI